VVAILLVAGGVLTAFFYPRNVDVSILSINASADYIIGTTLTALSKNNTDTAILEMEVRVQLILADLTTWEWASEMPGSFMEPKCTNGIHILLIFLFLVD
jgi:hypothetical protein